MKKWLGWFARAGVSLILIALIVRLVGSRNLGEVFLRVHVLTVVPAVVILWANIIIFTRRWSLVLRACAVEHAFRRLLYLDLWGWVGNVALPTTVAGDTVRVGGFLREQTAHGAAASVLLDRSLALGTQIVSGILLSALFLFMGGPLEFLLVMLIAAAVFGGGFALLVWASLAGKTPRWLPQRLRGTLEKSSRVLGEGLRHMGSKPLRILHVCSLSLVIHLGLALSWSVLFHAVGTNPGFFGVFISVPIIGIISMLPISVGGLGTREGAFALFFGVLGVPAEDAVVVSLLFYLANVAGSFSGLLFFKVWEWAPRLAGRRAGATE